VILIWKTHHDSGDGIRPPRYYAAIPGYDTWPVDDGIHGHPRGWSKRNLSRFVPDLYDSAATRQGPFAAALFRPPVLKTRVGLSVLERIQFDDHEYNVKNHFPGQSKLMRPRGFTAAEELSSKFWASYKPTLWDMEEEAKKALTEKDAMWFVIYILTMVGYRLDEKGTWLVVEKGTMAVEGGVRRAHPAGDQRARKSERAGDVPQSVRRWPVFTAFKGKFQAQGARGKRLQPH